MLAATLIMLSLKIRIWLIKKMSTDDSKKKNEEWNFGWPLRNNRRGYTRILQPASLSEAWKSDYNERYTTRRFYDPRAKKESGGWNSRARLQIPSLSFAQRKSQKTCREDRYSVTLASNCGVESASYLPERTGPEKLPSLGFCLAN